MAGPSLGDLMESVPCGLCGADDASVIYPAVELEGSPEFNLSEVYATSSGHRGAERIVRCRRCGLVYVNPRLRKRLILMGYRDADNSLYLAEEEGRLESFRRAAARLKEFVPARARVLDVGCAAGYFLKAAGEAGWRATGLEVSRNLVEYGRDRLGVDSRQGSIEEHGLQDGGFDMVCFWDVLEHVYDPLADLVIARGLLKPGGLLVVSYPDYSSVWARLLGRSWWFLISIHLTYFTPKTMAAMAAMAGFEPVARWMHFQRLSLDYLLYRLEPYLPTVSKAGRGLASWLGLGRVQVPYYASQAVFVGRRTG